MIVANIMSRKVHTVTPGDKLSDLRSIFAAASYRHLLVEENDKLVGVISDRDVLAHLSPFLDTEQERDSDRGLLDLEVRDIMSSPALAIDSDMLIDSASILLLENHISCLPVVDTNMAIEGIVSWKDILLYHVYGIDTTLAE